jgi:hypothetical protein
MATNFLYAPGTHGFIVAPPVTVMTTELNTLGSGNSAVSSVGGTSGVFTQTTFGNCVWAEIELVAGGAFTPSAGGYISGWWLLSEAGSTFEKTVSNTDMPRSPDFTIPLFNSAYATSDIAKASGFVRLPAYDAKLFVVNHAGVALASSGNIIKVGPFAIQY